MVMLAAKVSRLAVLVMVMVKVSQVLQMMVLRLHQMVLHLVVVSLKMMSLVGKW